MARSKVLKKKRKKTCKRCGSKDIQQYKKKPPSYQCMKCGLTDKGCHPEVWK